MGRRNVKFRVRDKVYGQRAKVIFTTVTKPL